MAGLRCRSCGRELSIFQSDLCSPCRAERDRLEDHQARQTRALEEAASLQREAAYEATAREYEDARRAVGKEQAREDRRRSEQRREYVRRLISAADALTDLVAAVPDDPGAKLDFISQLANFYPKSWEEWLAADGVIPHRVEVAYARHRAVVVPLLEAALAARAAFPTPPDRPLRALATSFLFRDFDAVRRVHRDLPSHLEPTRQKARAVADRIKALNDQKNAKKQELRGREGSFLRGTFSALQGRTRAVIEDELRGLDEDVAGEKRAVAGLDGEARRLKRAFEWSQADPAARAILGALDGDAADVRPAADGHGDLSPLEDPAPVRPPPAGPPSPRPGGLTPEQAELVRLIRDMLAMQPSDISAAWQYPHVVRGPGGRYRTAKDEAAGAGGLGRVALVKKLLNPAQELASLLRRAEPIDGALPAPHARAASALVRDAEAARADRPAPLAAKVGTAAAVAGLLLVGIGLAFAAGLVAFVGLIAALGGAAAAAFGWGAWFAHRKLCRDVRGYLSPFLRRPDPGPDGEGPG